MNVKFCILLFVEIVNRKDVKLDFLRYLRIIDKSDYGWVLLYFNVFFLKKWYLNFDWWILNFWVIFIFLGFLFLGDFYDYEGMRKILFKKNRIKIRYCFSMIYWKLK